jgi:HSP20 family protein
MVETNTVAFTDPKQLAISERALDAAFTPPVNIYETDQEILLTSDMPGVRAEDVELRYERGELMLYGRIQARERNGSLLSQEYEEGDFYRTFTLSESIDSSKIDAKCNNGVLTVRLPKVVSAHPKQIIVRGLEARSGGEM